MTTYPNTSIQILVDMASEEALLYHSITDAVNIWEDIDRL